MPLLFLQSLLQSTSTIVLLVGYYYHYFEGGQLTVGLRFRPVDQRVTGSIPDSTNFLTDSFGQATNALMSLFTKQ